MATRQRGKRAKETDTPTPQHARSARARAKVPPAPLVKSLTERRHGQRFKSEAEKLDVQEAFLKSFAQMGIVSVACFQARIHRSTVYDWLEHDADFAAAFKEALPEANDTIRAAIFRRAITGVEKPLVSMGRVVVDADNQPIMVREYSDSLLALLAKSRMPEFRERTQMELMGRDGGPLEIAHAVAAFLHQPDASSQASDILERVAIAGDREPGGEPGRPGLPGH